MAVPWFVARPRLAILTGAGLMAATMTLRLTETGLADLALLLFTLPITLIAATFGPRGGAAAGLVAIALQITAAVADHQPLSVFGWAIRLAPLLVIGLVLGDAADRLRCAQVERSRLEQTAQRHHDAVQLNDTIVQSLAAAKWALESGDLTAGLNIVTEALDHGNRMVSDLIRGADLRPLWMGDPVQVPRADDRHTSP